MFYGSQYATHSFSFSYSYKATKIFIKKKNSNARHTAVCQLLKHKRKHKEWFLFHCSVCVFTHVCVFLLIIRCMNLNIFHFIFY